MAITERRKLGNMGEDAVTEFLVKRGYEILDRNYSRKWGELDIVAKKGSALYFVEVKTVTCVTGESISQETAGFGPEAQMHFGKRQRMARIIETYLLDKKVSPETPFQIDLAMVWYDADERFPRIEMMEDIVL